MSARCEIPASHPIHLIRRLSSLGRPNSPLVTSVLLLGMAVSLLWSPIPPGVAVSLAGSAAPAEEHLTEGLNRFDRGDFEKAVGHWTEAARQFERAGKVGKQIDALVLISRAYQTAGHYKEALRHLQKALDLARKQGDRTRIARVLGALGNLLVATGPPQEAQHYLSEGLALARKLGRGRLQAEILNNLGRLRASEGQYRQALDAFNEAIELATVAAHRSLIATAEINAAGVLMEAGSQAEARSLLDRAVDRVSGLADSNTKALALINIGLGYRKLRPHLQGPRGHLVRRASEALRQAAKVAEAVGDPRSLSYALGYLGTVHEDAGHLEEALALTRRATFEAQKVSAFESLYRWHWQTARLLKKMDKIDGAISAYRRAVGALQSVRQEMTGSHRHLPASYRDTVGAVYFELVDLLLRRAGSVDDPERYAELLNEARETVELLKVAELRDYFHDECFDAARSRVTQLEAVSKTAVVIYPIILPDRTELLVSLPAGLKRFTIQVSAERLSAEVEQFRRMLEKRTTREYLPPAQRLYDWLIRPLEPDLRSSSADTLVFVPDGCLRTVPMAALHDGEQFLVTKYALAITPGLNLTDPRSLERGQVNVLAAGLTESTQGFPPLPNVPLELQAIQGSYGGKVLLNQDFVLPNIQKALKEEQYTVVHIASHGQFEAEVGNTFILTFDGRLTMNLLDQCVGLFRLRDEPLELLTLSACETAAGDDRAALGLAGVAVKAGARSALATLWYINDRASSMLVASFYENLRDPSVSRAAALRQAQMRLLNDPRYHHPGYWAPFLLINNWL